VTGKIEGIVNGTGDFSTMCGEHYTISRAEKFLNALNKFCFRLIIK